MRYTLISEKASEYLAKELNYDEEKQQVLAYAVENILLTVMGFVVVIAVGVLLQAPLETLLASISGIILRKFSGGAHASTRTKCLIIGAILYPGAGWLIKNLSPFGGYQAVVLLALGIVSFLLVFLYAPVDSPAKPIVSPEFRRRLRNGSIGTVLICMGIAIISMNQVWALPLVAGLFVQSLSLLPFLNKGGENNA